MQSRQASRRTPQTNKQMATVMKVLPVAFGIFSLQFPAGLVLYFCVSNFWRLGQQEVIFRRYGTAANPTHRSSVNPAKAGVVDVESRELPAADDDEDAEPDEPLELEAGPPVAKAAKRPPAKAGSGAGKPASRSGAAKPPAKATPKSGAGNGAKPVAPAPKGGGFRSIFQLPPPPGEAPKTAPAKPAAAKPSATAKKPTTTTSSTTARPGTTGRRTSKKKPKR
jgi:hypothetical protein